MVIEINDKDYNIIRTALLELPAKISMGLIANLDMQFVKQKKGVAEGQDLQLIQK